MIIEGDIESFFASYEAGHEAHGYLARLKIGRNMLDAFYVGTAQPTAQDPTFLEDEPDE